MCHQNKNIKGKNTINIKHQSTYCCVRFVRLISMKKLKKRTLHLRRASMFIRMEEYNIEYNEVIHIAEILSQI